MKGVFRVGKSSVSSRGRPWVIVLVLLAGLVFGGFLGDVAIKALDSVGISFLNWMRYGVTFGITEPLNLDLGIIRLVLGLTVQFTIIGIIGMLVSYFIYRRLR